MVIATYSGVDQVPRSLIRMAQSFEVPTAAIVAKVISSEPEPPTTMRKTIPGHVEAAVLMALAGAIYDGRAFEQMPILADALQDAGCDSEEVLTHCRGANRVHVRGCWVLDLVLGKH